MQNDIRPWGEVFNTSFNRSDFGTYVGAGGWIEVLLRLVRIVRVIYLINRRLKELGNKQQVILHVYGDVPSILLEALSKYSFVKFIGYYIEHSEFIKRLSTADLFIEIFPFPNSDTPH
jgi:hypothetical protein